MQAVLVMFRSDGERRSFSIARDITVVGRREDCDLRIPLGDVSRKHCRIVRDGDALKLEDLGSSNGTYLNGRRVQKEALLSPGDTVQVGPVVFVLQINGEPPDEELRPVTEPTAPVADVTAAAATPREGGPLNPTAQSEYGEIGEIEELEPVDEPTMPPPPPQRMRPPPPPPPPMPARGAPAPPPPLPAGNVEELEPLDGVDGQGGPPAEDFEILPEDGANESASGDIKIDFDQGEERR